MASPDRTQDAVRKAVEAAYGVLHAYGEGNRAPGVSKEKVLGLLASNNTLATTILVAVQHLFKSNAFLAWEPESVWLELNDKGVTNFPRVNRDKLMAASTIMMGDAFHYDALMFEKMVIAFNDLPIDGEVIQEASPGEIVWGVVEAELLAGYAGYPGDYDYEPIQYIATSAHRDGLVLLNEFVNFAQEELDNMNHGDKNSNDPASLRNKVSDAWSLSSTTKTTYVEDEVGTQLARLSAIDDYLRRKTSQLLSEITIFKR